ncbi:MAG: hypothetical protein M3150_10190 [Pseudomonadota bacterium]|nr:hypothetical protein [Pseudomonadota bacterium]
MVNPVPLAAFVLAVSVHWAAAAAGNIYRCGDSYSDLPCAGATMVSSVEAPTAIQREQAEAATRHDAKTAALMEKERLRAENEPAQATIPKPAPRPPPPLLAEPRKIVKRQLRRPEYFTAVAPRKVGDALARKKSRKAPKTAAT